MQTTGEGSLALSVYLAAGQGIPASVATQGLAAVVAEAVGLGQQPCVGVADPAGCGQHCEGVHCGAGAQPGVATAEDHLVDLGVEFAFADAATAALQVEARSEFLAFGEMVADLVADFADFGERGIVEAAAPDEGLDGGQEAAAECDVAGGGPGADEG